MDFSPYTLIHFAKKRCQGYFKASNSIIIVVGWKDDSVGERLKKHPSKPLIRCWPAGVLTRFLRGTWSDGIDRTFDP